MRFGGALVCAFPGRQKVTMVARRRSAIGPLHLCSGLHSSAGLTVAT